MVASLPTLNALWRPNGTGPSPQTRDDRELIRSYSGQPAVQIVLHDLTVTMNRMADISPAGVAQVQAWINEVETLETQWSGYVADGSSAQLSTPLKRADVLEWDTSGATSQGGQASVIAGRIGTIKGRILTAMGLTATTGQAQLVRS